MSIHVDCIFLRCFLVDLFLISCISSFTPYKTQISNEQNRRPINKKRRGKNQLQFEMQRKKCVAVTAHFARRIECAIFFFSFEFFSLISCLLIALVQSPRKVKHIRFAVVGVTTAPFSFLFLYCCYVSCRSNFYICNECTYIKMLRRNTFLLICMAHCMALLLRQRLKLSVLILRSSFYFTSIYPRYLNCLVFYLLSVHMHAHFTIILHVISTAFQKYRHIMSDFPSSPSQSLSVIISSFFPRIL